MHSLSKQAGTAVREYRKIRKMSLEQLARMIQKSRSTVAKYETGEISMDLDTLYEISQALNAPVEAFFAHLNTQKKQPTYQKISRNFSDKAIFMATTGMAETTR